MKTGFVKICLTILLGLSPIANCEENTLYISEFFVNGNETLADEDGEYPDWIEIFNGGSQTTPLLGWHLTDDPANLTLWTFPEVTLSPGQYLIVFASGKDKAVSGKPLHTNFRLDSQGEYLALVQPDGTTIAHEYAPYPNQDTPQSGYSYGLRNEVTSFVSSGSSARMLVPHSNDLGSNWIAPSFDDSSWNTGTLGIGFGSTPGQFTVTAYSGKITVSSLAIAEQIIHEAKLQSSVYTEQSKVINYLDNDEDGNFANSVPFPGHSESVDVDNFVILATGTITIPNNSTWTFGINSDDGARLRIDDIDVIVDDTTHGAQDTFGTIALTSGRHDIEFLYFEQGGGAEAELFAAQGQYSTFDSHFKLVGDKENGGISMEGFGSLISKNVQESMLNANSSIYIRIPFAITDPTIPYKMMLQIRYNDGFVAYINGQEVARRNAPSQVAWNSAASQERSLSQSLVLEEFNLDDSQIALQAGENIIAIQGLNYAIDDDEFLIQPELIGIAVYPEDRRFFFPPTPGSENGSGVVGFVDDVAISQAHGFYDQSFPVELSTTTEECEIRYTTDGSEPTVSTGTVYSTPIQIEKTTTLRAAVFKPNYQPSDSKTQTYIFLDDILTQTKPSNYPTNWGTTAGDYEMDRDIVNNARYRGTIKNDLKSLPVMSIVTDQKHLFDSRTGIYSHPDSKGVAWERPVSTEFFYPDGSQEGFQINNGLRIQGGYGREPNMKKHSFRMLFKETYGPPTLRYKMFENSTVDKFDQLVLRSGYNYTWHGGEGGFGSSIAHADYLRDEFSRRLELATGQVASHGRFVHLYLNGMYWGLYNLCERPDDGFGAEYFGGEKEEYDVVTSGTRGISTTQVKAGNKDAWNAMMSLARAGGFQDTQKYEALQQYVDIDNLIDYMLVIYFTGNRDAPTVIGGGGTPWNFYSNRRRISGAGYRFFCWDSEWTLEEPTRNAVLLHTNGYDDPSFIFHKAKVNSDFRIRLADRIHKHFFNEGGLTSTSTLTIYSELASQIDRAIVGESARWGDVSSSSPKNRDDNWYPEIQRILTTYLPVRTETVLKQLQNAGFYPSLSAPEFDRKGGMVSYGSQVTINTSSTGTKDPVTTSLIKIDHVWKYNQSGTDLGSAWKNSDYVDSAWLKGKSLFYAETADLAATKNTPLTIGPTTFYFRTEFTIAESFDPSQATVQLSPFVDDGAIIYLNGQEAYRIGIDEGSVDYNTFANRTVSDATFEGPFEISAGLLHNGVNTIAVEIHQTNASSSDAVFGLTLDLLTPAPDDEPSALPIYYTLDGSDPRLPGGALNPKARKYEGSITITDNLTLKARSYSSEQWSAINEASYLLESAPSSVATVKENLRISELMFNPADGEEYEYIELHNTHATAALSLNGLGFTNGIDMVIPNGTTIPADGYILIVPAQTLAEQTAFRTHYGLSTSAVLVGGYSGKFSNSGEQITLSTLQDNSDVISFELKDARGWPVSADGAGHSMVPLQSAITEQPDGSLDYGGNWRASYALNGSPGAADPEPGQTVVINELVSNPQSGESDWIELYNPSSSPIDLGNWYLSDDAAALTKWAIPSGEIAAGGWITFTEEDDFDNPVGSGFGLSKDGETLYLSYLPGISGIDRIVDAVSFKAQDTDRAWGRFTDGNSYFVATLLTSQNSANEAATSNLVIDEIMYQPSALESGDDNTTAEYIELVNVSDKSITLQNDNGVYHLDGGVQIDFPADVELSSGERILLVSFDPTDSTLLAAFENRYGLTGSELRLFGPYTGKLSNRGERIAIEKPKGIDEVTLTTDWGIVDEVIYFYRSPWTSETNGTGKSLQRLYPGNPGNDPANWIASDPTPGTQATAVSTWMLYE